jgi:tetratricopeptide (TPR) repeat protein
MLREGLKLHGAGRLAEAAERYQQAHLADADDPEALLMLGILARQSNQPTAAIELTMQAVHLRPRRAHYHLNLGLAYFANGDYEAAENCYRDALLLDGKLAQAWCSLGELAQTRNNSTVAEGCYRLAAAVNPGHWQTALAHGNLLARQRRYREAEAVFATALALAPDEPELHQAAGAAIAAQGRHTVALEHYRRAIARQPNFAEAYLMQGNSLFECDNFVAAAISYQQAIRLRPGYTKAICNLGNTLFRLNRIKEAVGCYERALTIDPTLAAIYNNLGNALVERLEFERAEGCFRKALLLDASDPKFYNGLGNVLLRRFALGEAEQAYRDALALDPLYAVAHVNLATALMKQGRSQEMYEHYQCGLALNPDSPGARYNLSIADLRAGKFRQGWLGHESRWQFHELHMKPRPFAVDFGQTPAVPQWRGEAIAGKTILLHAEQGFGDTIQFARYAPLVAKRGARVVLEVQAPLRRLMSNLPGVDQVVAHGDPLPSFDLHCPLMSLPFAFDTTVETIPDITPYLSAPSSSIAEAHKRFPNHDQSPKSLRVGIIWAGNPKHRGDGLRSIHLSALEPLASIPGLMLISVQKDAATEQIRKVSERLRSRIIDTGATLNDFADTAALVSTLDLVISVDTAVAHLSGALGVPVWLLVPYLADWRWMENRDDSPWYPTTRIFRQPSPGDWGGVVDQVARTLRATCL